jgi:hypothetical protein
VTRQRTGFQQTQYQRGRYWVRSEYDAVIYLSFWDGRGKEKLWVQILYRLSIIKLNLLL